MTDWRNPIERYVDDISEHLKNIDAERVELVLRRRLLENKLKRSERACECRLDVELQMCDLLDQYLRGKADGMKELRSMLPRYGILR